MNSFILPSCRKFNVLSKGKQRFWKWGLMIFYLQVNSAYLLISTWLRKVEHAPCYILIEHHFTAANSEAALAILVSLKPFHCTTEEIQQPLWNEEWNNYTWNLSSCPILMMWKEPEGVSVLPLSCPCSWLPRATWVSLPAWICVFNLTHQYPT